MKKILIIITTDFVPYGGLTTVMMNYYRRIDKSRFKPDFASTNDEVDIGLMKELHDNGSEYYCLGDRKKKTISYIFNLWNLLKKSRYDVLHVNSNSATAAIELFAAKAAGVETRIVHNHTSKCDHLILHKILYRMFKRLYTDAVACSKRAGDWIFVDGNYVVLNNGIESDKFRFDKTTRILIRKKYNIADDCLLIGHVGKIYEPKNHPFLINIFNDFHRDHKNSKLILVGDGVMRQQIEKQVADLGLTNDVIFAGMQSNIKGYLSAIDIFVFPSIWEGMPLSVVEAQASGVKCIISNSIDRSVAVTDAVDMISIENGTKEWIDSINNAKIENRCIASEKGIEMIKQAEFDSGICVSKLEKIYSKGDVL